MSELITINGVRGFIDENGVAQLNAEDVSRGLGFIQKKGKATYVRWERINGYLVDMGFPQLVGKEYFPENVFYRLSMKGESESAVSFQNQVADEILPAIRKHGAYLTPQKVEEVLLNPDTIIKLATELRDERQKRLAAEQAIKESAPRMAYLDTILQSKGLVTTTQIAKDYGMTAPVLNKLLNEQGVQYKVNDQWVLYKRYADKGYAQSYSFGYKHKDGTPDVRMNTQWTQRGRLFIHEILTKLGIKANIDKDYKDVK